MPVPLTQHAVTSPPTWPKLEEVVQDLDVLLEVQSAGELL